MDKSSKNFTTLALKILLESKNGGCGKYLLHHHKINDLSKGRKVFIFKKKKTPNRTGRIHHQNDQLVESNKLLRNFFFINSSLNNAMGGKTSCL